MTDTPETLPPAVQPEHKLAVNDGTTGRATWSIPGDQVQNATAHYDAETRDLLRWLYAYAIDKANNLSMQAASDLCKVDKTTLFRVYKGTYRDGDGKQIVPTKLVEGIRTLRQVAEARADVSLLGFVRTETSDRVMEVCNAALKYQTVAFIWGPSHTGKTRALQEFRRRNLSGRVLYIRIEPSSGTHELVRQLAIAVGLSPKGAHDETKRRVAKSIDHTCLLVIDEVHELSFTYRQRSKLSCLELLRWLHDETNCGMVLCGTHIWRDEVTQGKDKALLEQLVRRSMCSLDLKNSPTAKDIAAIYGAYKLPKPTGDAAEEVRAIAKGKGIKSLIYRLSRAAKFAEEEKRAVTWDDVLEEHQLLGRFETGDILGR